MNLAFLQQQRRAFEGTPILKAGSVSPVIKRGFSYEDKVGAVLEEIALSLGWTLLNHPWIQHGDSWHQPDYVLISPSNSVVVFEVKLTYTEEGVVQLRRYKTVLSQDYSPITRVLVCKNLSRGCPKPVEDVWDITDNSVWHLYL